VQEGLEGFVRQERQDIQNADLQAVGFQDEQANETGLARVNETPKENDKHFGNFQEDLCAFLHAFLVTLDAFIAAVTFIFRRGGGDFNVVGVVPVALKRVENVLRGPIGLLLHRRFVVAKFDVLEFEDLNHFVS